MEATRQEEPRQYALIPYRIPALVFRVAVTICSAVGLYYFLKLDRWNPNLGKISYYTGMSNLMVLLVYVFYSVMTAVGLAKSGLKGPTTPCPWLKGATTLVIAVTFLIYHFILARNKFDWQIYKVGNLLVHYIVPLMVVTDWLLFDAKEKRPWWHPLSWLTFPVAYFIFTVIRAQVGGWFPGRIFTRYPYPFINVDRLGLDVIWNILGTAAGVVALGYCLLGIEYSLYRLLKRHADQQSLKV